MKKVKNLLQKVGFNTFLLGLILAIFMAWLFPKLGSSEGPIHWKPWINGGIALVFFFYGVKLNPRQLMEGLSNWKLHLTIQLFTFIVFPFLVLLIFRWLPWVDEDFELGITYLAALPSTVSASVVMVNIAGGNVPAAIFNASISGLLGVVITPAWMGILAENLGQGEVDFWPTFVDLTIKVILPVFAGVLLHGKLFPLIRSHLKRLKYLDQAIIMMIVFTAFSDSFYQKIFQPYSWLSLLKIAFLMLILFLMVLLSIELVSRFLGFSIKDRITALFCGSKKSLVHGVVIGKVMFPDPAVLGLVLLPVMLYHFQQLLIGSSLAEWFGRKNLQ
ncbi:MAG: solute carrier family 10 (sodium/bile acid cotransporter), member 7 [Algoriphagus marincola HL-49]|uniref:Solute carrier family 10 (Sodium/bile acid cotransporter), member 7 n=1 Tax=Algoriphagus marincola HL-49 TaxID=1305737 RepID=A0A0N8KGY5_9BACT|nr:MAG: solute carrier family 10 (sodium/bile acid cotransporter), member 7 [Algoriphagus marincola HL-49]